MVYITVANSKRILRKLDLNDLDLTGQVYDKPLFFLNKREEQALLAYKEFMQSPEMFVEDIYQKVKVEDRFMYVYEGDAPCYHQREDCERLNAEFRNFIIPHSIRERGTDCVIRFREWFKENIYLLDGKKDVFEMRINAAFGVRISLEEIVKVNSGISSTINWDLGTLQDELNEKIKEAGRYYYKSPMHTKILKQYSKYSFLGNYSEALYSNNTGYSDEKVKELLRDYEENIKKPIINMLYDYYRVKFNPELEMEGSLLEQLGFRACAHCF